MKKQNSKPPILAEKFFAWYCDNAAIEDLHGDMTELFYANLERMSVTRAKLKYCQQVLSLVFSYAIKKRKQRSVYRPYSSHSINQNFMIGNYFKVASRNILKRKMYSFINAFGLSVGIAFCILIYLFIRDEKSFDQFHANKNQIYRMEAKRNSKNPSGRDASLQFGLRNVLKDEVPQIKYATRFNTGRTVVLRYRDKIFSEKISYVDGDFFKMFSFKLFAGNAEKLFENTLEAVITPAIAEKYFGKEDAMGKIISIDNGGERLFTIAGIIEAPPANSSLDFQILVPEESIPGYEKQMTDWRAFGTPCFVQLSDNADAAQFRASLGKVGQKYMGDIELAFTPLTEMHLMKSVGWHKVSDPQYAYILGGLALLILVMACINYISLALTTSASRRKEVGVRKVTGAGRKQLMYQFGFESLLLACISMLIGIMLVILFLPSFNQFTGKGIVIAWNDWAELLSMGLALTFVVGLLAGSYPSVFLSRFQPALVLKGHSTSQLQAGFTKPLVVLQFFLSASLIICSVIMYRQMKFVATKDLGYNKEQTLVIQTQTGWRDKEANKIVERFRTRAQGESGIVSVAGTGSSFNQGVGRFWYKFNDEEKAAYVYAVDPNYLPTLGIQLAQGRNFDANIFSDSSAVIVNEALVKDLKWTDPLNEHLNWREDTVGLGSKVIGVVKDYHFLSLEENIEPLFLTMDEFFGYHTKMLVRVEAGNIPASVDKVRSMWKELFPDKPLDYTFLDQDVAKQYESYERWMSITGLATGFAILISCMGLFGLAGINAVNRTKEIGIRKVLGAGMSSIFILLNKQYVWLSLIAFALAVPLSWYLMSQWLTSFKFSIAISWELFALSTLAGLVIALATVSYHAFKTALVNPAETLKYE
ncbi:ABC transporter permease [Chryseolinea soli]|uniref:ABC transporter permease n=1 Tax=Chryseolinea soli TaxID=2321403 RepID=A0A385SKK6_9BACT|nr:ABC transporter permease [Chryseolinea soli]AYB31494.1 ABC transporter permease [Chryseolinea soli]